MSEKRETLTRSIFNWKRRSDWKWKSTFSLSRGGKKFVERPNSHDFCFCRGHFRNSFVSVVISAALDNIEIRANEISYQRV